MSARAPGGPAPPPHGARSGAHPGRSAADRVNAWFEQRLPRSDQWLLRQNNLYILPTRAGWGFCATLLVMLLAAINYQLNLGYALTFLLGGAALVSLHQTHGNLRRLTLQLRPPQPVFAGEPATLEIVLDNPGGARHGIGLGLNRLAGSPPPGQPGPGRGRLRSRRPRPAELAWVDVPAQGSAVARLRLPPLARGEQPLPALRVQTHFPLGLFRAWTVWRPAATLLVYPQPERPAPPLPLGPAPGHGGTPQARKSGGEFEGVRAHRRGDTLRQVVWKKFARSGELVSRELGGSAAQALTLDFAQAGPGDAEARLSRLAAWVLAAEQAGLAWALTLPGCQLPREAGSAQRQASLQALARW